MDRDDDYVRGPPLPFAISQRAHVDHGRSCINRFEQHTYRGRQEVKNAPVALKLGADDTGARTPEIVADDPVTLVLEHALVERLDVASVGS